MPFIPQSPRPSGMPKLPLFEETPKSTVPKVSVPVPISSSKTIQADFVAEALQPLLVESTPVQDVSSMLQERGARYGKFSQHAFITQAFKLQAADFTKQNKTVLTADMQEALDMIFHKIGRILNGDPTYADSWKDIAGYAQLVSDRLEKGLER